MDLNFHRETLRRSLGLPSKIPIDFEGTFENVPCYRYPPKWWDDDTSPTRDKYRSHPFIGHFNIIVKKGITINRPLSDPSMKRGIKVPRQPAYRMHMAKSSTHRVFVLCKCGKEVPAGRMGQHKCKHWPTAEMVKNLEELKAARQKLYEAARVAS